MDPSVSLDSILGVDHLAFSNTFHEFYMTEAVHAVSRENLQAIADDAAGRVRRRCGLDSNCSKQRKDLEKERRDALGKLAELSETIKEMVENVKTQTVTHKSAVPPPPVVAAVRRTRRDRFLL